MPDASTILSHLAVLFIGLAAGAWASSGRASKSEPEPVPTKPEPKSASSAEQVNDLRQIMASIEYHVERLARGAGV